MRQLASILALVALTAPACTKDQYASARQDCVDEINAYRATEGLPPYDRWEDGEVCADGEAKTDSAAGVSHTAFNRCGEWAQNSCPGWGSVESIITGCLAMMWAEGPGEPFLEHGHYLSMSNTGYTKVACGFHVTADGDVWAIQNFR